MIDKPKDTKVENEDTEILEPDEVVSDAAETAFMEDAAERENAKK